MIGLSSVSYFSQGLIQHFYCGSGTLKNFEISLKNLEKHTISLKNLEISLKNLEKTYYFFEKFGKVLIFNNFWVRSPDPGGRWMSPCFNIKKTRPAGKNEKYMAYIFSGKCVVI